MDAERALINLNASERDCLLRFISLVMERLGEELCQIWVFGSTARGDMWPDHMPFHSDVDLLLLTRQPVSAELEEELLNETYPLFLECGRQISPQWRTMDWFQKPDNERAREFIARVTSEGQILFQK